MHLVNYDLSMTHAEQVQWDLAGLGDGRGLTPRSVASGDWCVPEFVECVGERLVWRSMKIKKDPDRSEPAYKRVRADSRLLGQFVRLADAPGERILRFAKKWGLLGICRHG